MSDDEMPADWPMSAKSLAALIGVAPTRALIAGWGGLEKVSVPCIARPDHPMAHALGFEAYQRLVDAYGGDRIDVPRAVGLGSAKRRLVGLLADEMSGRQAARQAGCTERHVRRLRQQWREAAAGPQLDLFKDRT